MKINGESLPTLAVFPSMIAVSDSVVVGSNKLGQGHGEAKLYISSKDDMYSFFGAEKFKARCFMLKSDLTAYMDAIRNEYMTPSYDYAGRDELPKLWEKHMELISGLDDVVFFDVYDQYQLSGVRGYVNSPDSAYRLIRQIALPLVSYIYVEKVGSEAAPLFYWKLFVDFDAIRETQSTPFVFQYRKAKDSPAPYNKSRAEEKKESDIRQARNGQGRYRELLLEQCRFCPFTMIADERLLIASHIKPWAASTDAERIDPYNGYMLSPLYDKLFDRGFITFTENRHLILSEFISPFTWKQLHLKNDTFIKALPMDDKRAEYLKFHHKAVFKGSFFED